MFGPMNKFAWMCSRQQVMEVRLARLAEWDTPSSRVLATAEVASSMTRRRYDDNMRCDDLKRYIQNFQALAFRSICMMNMLHDEKLLFTDRQKQQSSRQRQVLQRLASRARSEAAIEKGQYQDMEGI